MPYLAFDIETVANARAGEYFQKKEYKPDPKYSDPEEIPAKILDLKTPELRENRMAEWREQQKLKIEKNILEKRQRDMDQAGLYWWTGKIVSICAIPENGQPHVWFATEEKAVLNSFFRQIEMDWKWYTPIGKSSQAFDIPFIIGRAMANDMGIPDMFRLAREPMLDINRIFSHSDSCPQVTSLDNYAWGLGLPGKTGKGNQVAEWYSLALQGDDKASEQLMAYNQQDTQLVIEILTRYQKRYQVADHAPIELDGIFEG